jgi:hypothetical protein
MVIVIINYCYYNMFTLEQQIFIVQCFFSNGERLGPIRHLEFLKNFNKRDDTSMGAGIIDALLVGAKDY